MFLKVSHTVSHADQAQAQPKTHQNIGKLENLYKNCKILENIEKKWKLKVFQYIWSTILEKHNVFDGFGLGWAWPCPGQAQPRPGPAQAQAQPKTPQNIGKLENLNKNWKILENIGKLKVFQYVQSEILEKL